MALSDDPIDPVQLLEPRESVPKHN
jgi:hypothetical protein